MKTINSDIAINQLGSTINENFTTLDDKGNALSVLVSGRPTTQNAPASLFLRDDFIKLARFYRDKVITEAGREYPVTRESDGSYSAPVYRAYGCVHTTLPVEGSNGTRIVATISDKDATNTLPKMNISVRQITSAYVIDKDVGNVAIPQGQFFELLVDTREGREVYVPPAPINPYGDNFVKLQMVAFLTARECVFGLYDPANENLWFYAYISASPRTNGDGDYTSVYSTEIHHAITYLGTTPSNSTMAITLEEKYDKYSYKYRVISLKLKNRDALPMYQEIKFDVYVTKEFYNYRMQETSYKLLWGNITYYKRAICRKKPYYSNEFFWETDEEYCELYGVKYQQSPSILSGITSFKPVKVKTINSYAIVESVIGFDDPNNPIETSLTHLRDITELVEGNTVEVSYTVHAALYEPDESSHNYPSAVAGWGAVIYIPSDSVYYSGYSSKFGID